MFARSVVLGSSSLLLFLLSVASLTSFLSLSMEQHFMVAGPLRIFLSLHSPPPTLRVYAIKVYIEQKGDLTSFRFRPTKTTRVLLKGSVLESGWKGPYGSNSLSRLLQDGREGEEMLFDASVGDAWTFEQVARIVSRSSLLPVRTAPLLRVSPFFSTDSLSSFFSSPSPLARRYGPSTVDLPSNRHVDSDLFRAGR